MQSVVNLIKCDWLKQPKVMPPYELQWPDKLSVGIKTSLVHLHFFSSTLTQNALTHSEILTLFSCVRLTQSDSSQHVGQKEQQKKHPSPPSSTSVTTAYYSSFTCCPLLSLCPILWDTIHATVTIFCLKCNLHTLSRHSVRILALYNDTVVLKRCLVHEGKMWSNHSKEMIKNNMPAV